MHALHCMREEEIRMLDLQVAWRDVAGRRGVAGLGHGLCSATRLYLEAGALVAVVVVVVLVVLVVLLSRSSPPFFGRWPSCAARSR